MNLNAAGARSFFLKKNLTTKADLPHSLINLRFFLSLLCQQFKLILGKNTNLGEQQQKDNPNQFFCQLYAMPKSVQLYPFSVGLMLCFVVRASSIFER